METNLMEESIAIINSVADRSTGKIASGLLKYLISRKINAVLCYGRGKKPDSSNLYRIDYPIEFYVHALLCRITGFQGAYSRFATKRLIKVLKKRNVSTIFGIGLHGYYLNEKIFFNYVIENDIKFVYIMTEEYAYLGKCGYSNGCTNYLHGCGHCPQKKEYPKSLFFDRSAKIFRVKQEAYIRLKHKVFVGPEYTILAAKKSPLLNGIKTEIIDEAIDLSFYYPRDTKSIREELKIPNNKIVIVCVAPSAYWKKGTVYFHQLAEQMLKMEKFVFVHVGYTGDVSKCPSNLIPIGYEADQNKLAEYYSLADLFVFPSLLDTMPNACLEALACGSPLLCFNNSGMPYIADSTTATFVEPKNVEQMVDVVRKTSKKNNATIDICRKYAESRYDNQKYYQKLYNCSKEL